MKNAKNNKKSNSKKTISRKKTTIARLSTRKKKEVIDPEHTAALREAKKVGKVSADIGVNVEVYSGDTKTISFPNSRKKRIEIPIETLRTLRSKVTGEIITLIHNGVARLNRLSERLDFRIRDPRNVQFVGLNTEGLVIEDTNHRITKRK